MKSDDSKDPAFQSMLENMPEKTGKSIKDWEKFLRSKKVEKHSEIMALLKNEMGVSHGYANTIALLYRQNLAGGPQGDDELITNQYSKKPHLKPWYDQLVDSVSAFGEDVTIAPKKAYVSLRRAKQFAIIQPSTQTRMDLGLNLPEVNVTGCLIEGDKWSGMCSHRIELHQQSDITPEVIDWLNQAYQSAA